MYLRFTFLKIKHVVREFIKEILPKKIIHRHKRKKNKKYYDFFRKKLITSQEIKTVLNQFIVEGDVIIHSSTSNFGKFEGGWITLYNALMDLYDLQKQTILAPAFPTRKFMQDYLSELEVFYLNDAPNLMGNISNKLMAEKDCFRSFHPSHSTLALGKDAEEYVNTHHHSLSPFDEKSPFYKLVKNNGHILLLGVDLNSATVSRVYEDMLGSSFPLPIYLKKVSSVYCVNKNNEPCMVDTRCHNRFYSRIRNNELARNWCVKAGIIKTISLGNANVSILNAQKYTLLLLEMLLKGKSVYGKIKLNRQQTKAVQNKIEQIKSGSL